jgi:tRNA threonylcarbamoyladenosine biosynthesis protein TsaB
MKRIVAIDTTGQFGSLALVQDGVVVEEMLLESPDGFAHVLFPHLDKLMLRHGWSHASVTGYAAAAGPGSFTGVRVGLAAIKGLAEAAGARAAAVSNLMAMASYGSAALRAPFFDARRGEIYGAVYDSSLRLIGRETVGPFGAWQESLPAEAELLTPAPEVFGVVATKTPRGLAGAIGRLAGTLLADPASIDANYVRRSDAELKWKDIYSQ